MSNPKKKCPSVILLLAICFYLTGCDVLSEADVPVLKSEIEVDSEKIYGLQGNFKWLDNDRIIAASNDQINQLPGSGYPSKKLVVWDTSKNTATVFPYSNVDGLCVINQTIRFYTRQLAPDPTGVRHRIESRQYYEGNLSAFKPINLVEPIERTSCESRQDRTFLPAWAQSIPDINIIRLKPEHGFIWIERDAKKLMEKPKAVWLYLPHAEKNQGIDISKVMGSFNKKNPYGIIEEYSGFGFQVKYYQYKKAYLAFILGIGWWIYPDGKLESFPDVGKTNFKLGRKGLSEVGMTRAGMLFGTHDFVNAHVDKDDGLFLRDTQLNVKRLVHGRIGYELEVSPNGCKVAYGIDRRKTMGVSRKLVPTLEVINLCKEHTS